LNELQQLKALEAARFSGCATLAALQRCRHRFAEIGLTMTPAETALAEAMERQAGALWSGNFEQALEWEGEVERALQVVNTAPITPRGMTFPLGMNWLERQ
jgi:hypothetical protein